MPPRAVAQRAIVPVEPRDVSPASTVGASPAWWSVHCRGGGEEGHVAVFRDSSCSFSYLWIRYGLTVTLGLAVP